jgi:hypothetical protein
LVVSRALVVNAILACASVLGCGSAPTFPSSVSTGVMDRVLGGAPEIVVTGHVADALKDPLWESSKATFFEDIDRLTRSPEAMRALASIDRVELYVRLSSPTRVVGIFREVPSALTPEVILARDGQPAYPSRRTLSSGVREYAPRPSEHGHVFVLPNHDWVVADDVSSSSVAAVLASDASSAAFPAPNLGLDRTAVAHFSATFFDHAAQSGWLSQPTPIEGALVGIGDARKVELYVKYATASLAQRAEGENQELLRSRLAGIEVSLARNGTVLGAIFTLPDLSRSFGRSTPPPRESPPRPSPVPPPQVAIAEPPKAPPLVPGLLPPAFICDGPIVKIAEPAPPPRPAPPPPSRPAPRGKPGKAGKRGKTGTSRPKGPELDLDDPGPGPRAPVPVGPPPSAGQMTEQAATAKRSFDSERWEEAAQAYESVIDGTSGDDEGNRQLAQYHRAISLFRLRRFPESAALFRGIAVDSRHLKHNETLLWLVKLSSVQPEQLKVTDFSAYRTEDVKRFDNAIQQDVYVVAAFLVARHRIAIGATSEAVELLSHVPNGHPYGAQARRCEAAR